MSNAVHQRLWQVIRELKRRVMLSAARGVLRMTNDGPGLQQLQVSLLDGEVRDKCEHAQPFGFSYHAPAGSEVFVLFPGGSRDHPIVIAAGNRGARPRALGEGEVIIYDNFGKAIEMRKNGITIKAAGKPITIENASSVRVDTPHFEVTGDIIDNCDTQDHTVKQMRAIYNAHGHPDPQGGTVAPPTVPQ